MRFLAGLLFALALASCQRPTDPKPLPQRAYVWQREWTPAVAQAVAETAKELAGQVILGGEVVWQNGKARWLPAKIDWPILRRLCPNVRLALRIAPYSGSFTDPEAQQSIQTAAHSLLDRATAAGLACAELQIDFDCAQRRLAEYAIWLRLLRKIAGTARFVITTLPVWLDEKDFPTLLNEVHSYVLQVHSVRPAAAENAPAICDPKRARRCVEKAADLGVPFEVALPTYSALVGFDQQGKVLGYVFEETARAWPPDTVLRTFETDPAEMANLVREWTASRPPSMLGVIWYRLPLTTDKRNWPQVTWRSVMAGRTPQPHLAIELTDGPLVDVRLSNQGDAASTEPEQVSLTWQGSQPEAAEALPGWRVERVENELRFVPTQIPIPPLRPGGTRAIGWLRFAQPTPLHASLTPLSVSPRQ